MFVRVAYEGERVYVDLANPNWEAVEIGTEGWRIVAQSPVRFRRFGAMEVLPAPICGGDLEQLRPFVNVGPSDLA